MFIILESSTSGGIQPYRGGGGQSFGASCDIHNPLSSAGFMLKNVDSIRRLVPKRTKSS